MPIKSQDVTSVLLFDATWRSLFVNFNILTHGLDVTFFRNLVDILVIHGVDIVLLVLFGFVLFIMALPGFILLT